jgi:hypothetical protein
MDGLLQLVDTTRLEVRGAGHSGGRCHVSFFARFRCAGRAVVQGAIGCHSRRVQRHIYRGALGVVMPGGIEWTHCPCGALDGSSWLSRVRRGAFRSCVEVKEKKAEAPCSFCLGYLDVENFIWIAFRLLSDEKHGSLIASPKNCAEACCRQFGIGIHFVEATGNQSLSRPASSMIDAISGMNQSPVVAGWTDRGSAVSGRAISFSPQRRSIR